MKKETNEFCTRIKRKLGKMAYFSIFSIPMLLLRIRQQISYEESTTIAKFFVSAARYQKQYLQALKVFFLLFFKVSWRDFSPDYSLFSKRQYKAENNAWSIGRWYSIKPEETKKLGMRLDSQNMKYFSIGREAIVHILRCNEFAKKIVLLPNFTCFTVLDPFIQEGWKICFYRYNKDLSIDSDYFLEVFNKEKPSICVFQPLSGMGFLEAEKNLIEFAHKKECMTIVDQTQDIYNHRNDPFVDYYCASLRKWYPFPDGAFLYSEKRRIEQFEEHKKNNIYQTSMGLCMFAAHLRSIYDDLYFDYLHNFMWTFSVSYIGNTNIVPHTMSDYSRQVLLGQNEEDNTKRRVDNFNYIYRGIEHLEKVKPAFATIERLTCVPLSFPVYVDNRQKFSTFLAQNGIVTQLLWGKPPYIKKYVDLDETTEYIYSHIISLPCDQRYDLEDMKRMVNVICAYEQC